MMPDRRVFLVNPLAVFVFIHGNFSVPPQRLYRENHHQQNYSPQNDPASARGPLRDFIMQATPKISANIPRTRELALSVVNLAAMADHQHKHGHFSVVDAVNDPIIPDTDSLAVDGSCQLATAGRPRVCCQFVGRCQNPIQQSGIAKLFEKLL